MGDDTIPDFARNPLGLRTMDDVAAHLGKSVRWLRDWIRDHPVGTMVGRSRRFTDDDLLKLLDTFPKDADRRPKLPPINRGGKRGRATKYVEPITATALIERIRRKRYDERVANYEAEMKVWRQAVTNASREGVSPPRKPTAPRPFKPEKPYTGPRLDY